jgi:hypothetical protein
MSIAKTAVRLKVTLDRVEPEVMRRFVVSADDPSRTPASHPAGRIRLDQHPSLRLHRWRRQLGRPDPHFPMGDQRIDTRKVRRYDIVRDTGVKTIAISTPSATIGSTSSSSNAGSRIPIPPVCHSCWRHQAAARQSISGAQKDMLRSWPPSPMQIIPATSMRWNLFRRDSIPRSSIKPSWNGRSKRSLKMAAALGAQVIQVKPNLSGRAASLAHYPTKKKMILELRQRLELAVLGIWRGSCLSGAGHTNVPAMFDRGFIRLRLSRLFARCRNDLDFETALRDRNAGLPLLSKACRAV